MTAGDEPITIGELDIDIGYVPARVVVLIPVNAFVPVQYASCPLVPEPMEDNDVEVADHDGRPFDDINT